MNRAKRKICEKLKLCSSHTQCFQSSSHVFFSLVPSCCLRCMSFQLPPETSKWKACWREEKNQQIAGEEMHAVAARCFVKISRLVIIALNCIFHMKCSASAWRQIQNKWCINHLSVFHGWTRRWCKCYNTFYIFTCNVNFYFSFLFSTNTKAEQEQANGDDVLEKLKSAHTNKRWSDN